MPTQLDAGLAQLQQIVDGILAILDTGAGGLSTVAPLAEGYRDYEVVLAGDQDHETLALVQPHRALLEARQQLIQAAKDVLGGAMQGIGSAFASLQQHGHPVIPTLSLPLLAFAAAKDERDAINLAFGNMDVKPDAVTTGVDVQTVPEG